MTCACLEGIADLIREGMTIDVESADVKARIARTKLEQFDIERRFFDNVDGVDTRALAEFAFETSDAAARLATANAEGARLLLRRTELHEQLAEVLDRVEDCAAADDPFAGLGAIFSGRGGPSKTRLSDLLGGLGDLLVNVSYGSDPTARFGEEPGVRVDDPTGFFAQAHR